MSSPLFKKEEGRGRGQSALDFFKQADVEEVQEAVDESATFLRDERKRIMSNSGVERLAARARAASSRKVSLGKFGEEKRKIEESIQLKVRYTLHITHYTLHITLPRF